MVTPDSATVVSRAHLGAWRTFRSYWFGNTFSAVGDYFTLVALPIAALNLTGSAAWVAAVEFAEMGAVLLMGMWLAGVADRSHARSVMAATAAVRGITVGALAVWFAVGPPPVAAVVGASFILGALRHLHVGAENVMISAVVPDRLIGRAGSRMELSEGVGNFTGAILGGIVTSFSVALAFGVDAATFAIALAAIVSMGHFTIDRTQHDSAQDTPARSRGSLGSGLDALREEGRYWRMLIATAITTLATACLVGQWVTLARRDLGLSDWQIGLGMALVGAGNIVGSLAAERFSWLRPNALVPGLIVFGSAPLAVGLSRSVGIAMLSMFLAGAAVSVVAVILQTYRTSAFDTAVQARVYSIHRITIDSLLLPGVLLGGFLADRIGSSEMFVVFGSVALAGPAAGLALGVHSIGLASDRPARGARPESPGSEDREGSGDEVVIDLRERPAVTGRPGLGGSPADPHPIGQTDDSDVIAAIAEGLRSSGPY